MKYYSDNLALAADYCKHYLLEKGQFYKVDESSCACGDVQAINIYEEDGTLTDTKIIICESCYSEAANHEKI